jgi:hypothetical protein
MLSNVWSVSKLTLQLIALQYQIKIYIKIVNFYLFFLIIYAHDYLKVRLKHLKSWKGIIQSDLL